MKKLSNFLIISLLWACESAEIKKATENFNRFEGTWIISKIDLSKVPTTLKVQDISGNMTFLTCKANKDALKDNKGLQGCIGNSKITGTDFIINIEHNQDNTEVIRLIFAKLDNQYSTTELNQINILSGTWKINEISDKKLVIIKQKSKSPTIPDFEVTLEATHN